MANPSYREEPAVVIGETEIIPVTLSLDTSSYADNDVLAAPQEVQNVARIPGGVVTIGSLVLLDEDDQGVDIDVLFLDADGSIGSENAAVGPTDAVARTILGHVSVTSADYTDLGNSQMATKRGLGLPIKAAAGTTSIWIAAVVRSGTPTFTASGIRLKLGVYRD